MEPFRQKRFFYGIFNFKSVGVLQIDCIDVYFYLYTDAVMAIYVSSYSSPSKEFHLFLSRKEWSTMGHSLLYNLM